jgi:putative transposase
MDIHKDSQLSIARLRKTAFTGCLHELLNETIFSSLDHAREALARWKDDYNTLRPHSRIGDPPPALYAQLSAPRTQRDGALRYMGASAPRPVAPPSQMGSNAHETPLIGG